MGRNKSKRFALIAGLLVVVLIMAYRSGYTLGSDLAERENSHEAGG